MYQSRNSFPCSFHQNRTCFNWNCIFRAEIALSVSYFFSSYISLSSSLFLLDSLCLTGAFPFTLREIHRLRLRVLNPLLILLVSCQGWDPILSLWSLAFRRFPPAMNNVFSCALALPESPHNTICCETLQLVMRFLIYLFIYLFKRVSTLQSTWSSTTEQAFLWSALDTSVCYML